MNDWFESFALTVSGKDDQGEEEEEGEKGDGEGDGMDVDEGPVVQARFMRALHELDYMGFVKHGGRKAEHVARTVFDCLERP